MTLLRDSSRSGDIPRGSDNDLENNGISSFSLNIVRNEAIWKNLKPFLVGVMQLSIICGNKCGGGL
jgi:hypothetical protein